MERARCARFLGQGCVCQPCREVHFLLLAWYELPVRCLLAGTVRAVHIPDVHLNVCLFPVCFGYRIWPVAVQFCFLVCAAFQPGLYCIVPGGHTIAVSLGPLS